MREHLHVSRLNLVALSKLSIYRLFCCIRLEVLREDQVWRFPTYVDTAHTTNVVRKLRMVVLASPSELLWPPVVFSTLAWLFAAKRQLDRPVVKVMHAVRHMALLVDQ